MSRKKQNMSRREFVKTATAAGLGAPLLALGDASPARGGNASDTREQTMVPKRPFGKTGENVSILSLGGVLKESDLLVFRQAFKLGVTYWDTADSYGWGKNEKAIGKYFTKFPDDRKDIFLVTKAATSDPEKLTKSLNQSLQRMNTSHINLYFIHYVSNVEKELTDEVKAWVDKAKAEGKIRYFGFSAHKNMEESMMAAAKLGWIDGIMMSYNYRLMVKDEMKRAVAACAEAGIGMTAMKTQAAFTANFCASIGSETDDALEMTDSFMRKGYTTEQAKLKVVWENPNIASICSAMPNMTILKANVEAALKENNLSGGDMRRLERFAELTAPGYCTGCANICEPAVDCDIPISDILRYSMYHNGYGDRDTASRLFRELPEAVKENIMHTDFRVAEKKCPQNIEIAKVLKGAVRALA